MLDRHSIDERIITLMAEILELDDPTTIRISDRLREDLGMDSLGSMELLSRLSEELDLDLDMQEAMDIETVKDACCFVDASFHRRHGHVHRAS